MGHLRVKVVSFQRSGDADDDGVLDAEQRHDNLCEHSLIQTGRLLQDDHLAETMGETADNVSDV